MSIFSNLVFFLLMLFSMGPAIADDPSGFANSQSNSLVSNDQDSTRTETRMEEVRRKLPDLKNLDDEAFVDAVHKLYYPEIDKKEFEKLMGYSRPSKVSTNLLHTIMFWLVLIGGFLGYAYMYRNEKMNKDANLIISNEEIGIKGWLKFFIVMLGIFSPALNFGSTANSFVESELAYETLAGSQVWENYKNVVWLIIAVFSGFNIFAALQLRFKWKPMSVTFARIAVALTPIGCILVGVVAPRLFTGGQYAIDNKIVGQIIYSIVISAIWLVYLHMSNLVHATYSNSHEKKSPHANNTDMPVVTSNQHESISSINGASVNLPQSVPGITSL
ncbi:DUF2569 family protein [Undibacterium sp. WLX3042]|uniref:DUF2569 family protein n=1 Tax=Undibacterium sp. WLX3042 TaxID=3412686 RepID=UPI003C2CCC3A